MTSKPANGKYYKEGETVEYEIVVKNTGDVELTDGVVTDELTGDEWTLDSLGVGDSETFTTTYKVTAADAEAGEVLNEVTATGEDPDGNEVTDEDDVTVDTGKVKKVPPHKVPLTGDSTPLFALIVLAIAAGVVALFARRRMTKAGNVRHAGHARPTRRSDRH